MAARIVGKRFWIAAFLGAAALVVAGRLLPLREWLDAFGAWTERLGPVAYALYAAAFVLVTVLLMPAIVLILGAGLFFGLVRGFVLVSISATLGAAASFLIGRYTARERVARWVAGNPRYAAIDRAVAEKGWRIVFLLRLSPFVPYVVSNYLYGLTAIRFGPYVLASWAGMLPLTFLYVSLGAATREVAGDPALPPGPLRWIVLGGGIAVTVVATIVATRVVRRAIAEEERRG
jgi:uncharacterized membrane protein YdjX (TVP38/TMEM64 family)